MIVSSTSYKAISRLMLGPNVENELADKSEPSQLEQSTVVSNLAIAMGIGRHMQMTTKK